MNNLKFFAGNALLFYRITYYCILFLTTLTLSNNIAAGSIVTTKHNLAISGPGPIKSTSEEEVCVFCHAPHQARRDTPYLWNRTDSTVNYATYTSSTINSIIGQPTGASKLCLSCHDGTIALGAVLTRPQEIPFIGGLRFLADGKTKLGSDLSDDHPISFLFDDALAATNGELNSPSSLTANVKLDDQNMLQCTSCHDPHSDDYGKFLVTDNKFSALCVSCHNKTQWNASSHSLSQATWNGTGTNPWPNTTYTALDENACGSCHSTHTAGGHSRLLNYALEEDNCLVCHNGNVATKNIESELIKPYSHSVQSTVNIHDPAEDFTTLVTKHVECADCHNPHQSNNNVATPVSVSGALKGVNGITKDGSKIKAVDKMEEICFKCHGDNNIPSFASISRQNQQLNTRLEFDTTNPSFHPVEGIGTNQNVPSLILSYTENSQITCIDCHNNNTGPGNGGAGPNGPHGSVFKFMLERNYTTVDNTVESSYEYAICYKCHDRNILLSDASGFPHMKHVVLQNTPCSACHDPHGVSNIQGNILNNSHLINFDVSIVFPNAIGQLKYETQGVFRGQCYLNCHGMEHNPLQYP